MTPSATIANLVSRLRAAIPYLPKTGDQDKRSVPELSRLHADTPACRDALLRFGKESDRDFTALAEGMSQLTHHLSELRTRTEQLDLVLSDRDEDRAISSAYLLYKTAVDLVHASVGIALAEQTQMKQISDALLLACGARDQFNRNHLMLRILAMNMRMEAVRLEPEYQAVFVNIAAAISEIDEKIVASTEGAFNRIEAVISEAGNVQGQSKDLEESLHRCAQQSIERIQNELNHLKTSLLPCSEQSREIVLLIKQTEPQTLVMINSLQHQDIVRQQLEHVADGFEDLCMHFDAGYPQENGTAGEGVDMAYVHRATHLQQAHLHSSRVEIEKAAHDVESGLRAMMDLCQPLLDRFASLEKSACAAFADCRVSQVFSDEIAQLLQVTEKSEAANDRSSHLVEKIEEVVRVFSHEISSHELDVKLVALNAQIAAARMSHADSLARIAEETSFVADNNASVTRALTVDLEASLERLHGIKNSSAEFIAVTTREKSDLRRSVTSVSEKLRALGSRIQKESAHTHREIESVYRENESILNRLNFNRLIAECYDPAELWCKQMLAASEQHAATAELSEAAEARLNSHRSRYTMSKENVTHAAALNDSGTPELFDPPVAGNAGTDTANKAQRKEPAVTSDQSFGDGIDLF